MQIPRIHPSRVWFIALSVACASFAACGGEAGPEDTGDPTTATVSMPAFSFTPFMTTIAVGGTVTFDFPNDVDGHNVIFARVAGAPADILPTKTAKVDRTFRVAGSFPYDCTIHPGMSGVVVAR
jgi:plastocyanin